MKSTEELKYLYDTQFKDDLAAMEKDRKVIKRLVILIFIIGFVFYISFKSFNRDGFAIVVAVIGILLVLFGGYTICSGRY